MMMDITLTTAPRSDQLNAEVLRQPITVVITKVTMKLDEDQPISIFWQFHEATSESAREGVKVLPWKPCKTMRRVLGKVWGKDASQFPGRSLTLFCDPNVKFGGDAVGGIRIRSMSGIDKPVSMSLIATKGKRNSYTVQPLPRAPEPAEGRAEEREAATGASDAASLVDEIDRCETADELKDWNGKNKAAYSALERPQFEMVKAAYLRRKGELTEAAA
jgi:hypothetical protein